MPTSPGPLLASLTLLWERLRADVPDLPHIRPAVSPLPRRADHGPQRWSTDETGVVVGLTVPADVLREGPDAVLEMVLHDAAHILNWKRGVADTTMRGAYHNQAFVTAAEEVGCEWPEGAERVPGRGFPDVRVSEAARARHALDLEGLAAAIPVVLPHLPAPQGSTSDRTQRITLLCQCDPPRRFRIGYTVADLGPIICGICQKPFAPG